MTQPVLHTDRLILRSLEKHDEEGIFNLRSDKRVNQYLGRKDLTLRSEAGAFIEKIISNVAGGNSYYWAITLKGDPSLVGTICIWNIADDRTTAEVGYEMDPGHQGKGIITEALAAVIEFGFNQVGASTLEAYTHKDNLASTRVLLKHHFVLQPDRRDSENDDLRIYTLSKN